MDVKEGVSRVGGGDKYETVKDVTQSSWRSVRYGKAVIQQ